MEIEGVRAADEGEEITKLSRLEMIGGNRVTLFFFIRTSNFRAEAEPRPNVLIFWAISAWYRISQKRFERDHENGINILCDRNSCCYYKKCAFKYFELI